MPRFQNVDKLAIAIVYYASDIFIVVFYCCYDIADLIKGTCRTPAVPSAALDVDSFSAGAENTLQSR